MRIILIVLPSSGVTLRTYERNAGPYVCTYTSHRWRVRFDKRHPESSYLHGQLGQLRLLLGNLVRQTLEDLVFRFYQLLPSSRVVATRPGNERGAQ